MDKKYDPVGKLYLRGKAAKIEVAGESEYPMRFFCFVEDVLKLMRGDLQSVRIFRDSQAP